MLSFDSALTISQETLAEARRNVFAPMAVVVLAALAGIKHTNLVADTGAK